MSKNLRMLVAAAPFILEIVGNKRVEQIRLIFGWKMELQVHLTEDQSLGIQYAAVWKKP